VTAASDCKGAVGQVVREQAGACGLERGVEGGGRLYELEPACSRCGSKDPEMVCGL